MNEELYDKFPCVFQQKLKEHSIQFPEGTEFEYKSVLAYRVIFNAHDKTSIAREDFKSYFELGKVPGKRRPGKSNVQNYLNIPEYYGISLFQDKRIAYLKFRMPNPSKKIFRGYVHSLGGPKKNGEDSHITWWLFENVDISSFTIIE